MDKSQLDKIVRLIRAGQVGIMPTDTIFGLVGQALDLAVVERIYNAKGRPPRKPFIILIGDISQLGLLHTNVSTMQAGALNHIWPGPSSIVLPCPDPGMAYLHRGTLKLAIRLPQPEWLRDLVNKTGPIVATSANLAGHRTGNDLSIIKQQLPELDFYVDGPTGSAPSQLGIMDASGAVEWVQRTA